MTPEERQACLDLHISSGRGRRPSPRRFLKRVGARDGAAWAAEQVEDAARCRDEDDLELALVAAAALGDSAVSRHVLREVLGEDWHHSHENVVTVLQRDASPDDLPAFFRAATWVPTYLEFDESRALGRKAVHAVAAVAGPEADAALVRLAGHEDDALARLAVRLLERRSEGSAGDGSSRPAPRPASARRGLDKLDHRGRRRWVPRGVSTRSPALAARPPGWRQRYTLRRNVLRVSDEDW